jgi:hypothetical protein
VLRGGDLGTIQAVYNGEFTDPDNRGPVVVYECLTRKEVLPAGYRFRADTFYEDVGKLMRTSPESGPLPRAYEVCTYDPLGRSS